MEHAALQFEEALSGGGDAIGPDGQGHLSPTDRAAASAWPSRQLSAVAVAPLPGAVAEAEAAGLDEASQWLVAREAYEESMLAAAPTCLPAAVDGPALRVHMICSGLGASYAARTWLAFSVSLTVRPWDKKTHTGLRAPPCRRCHQVIHK